MESARLGAFPVGLDDEYFTALQELVNAVSERWLGGPYPFNDLAEADVEEFLDLLERAEPIGFGKPEGIVDFLTRTRIRDEN